MSRNKRRIHRLQANSTTTAKTTAIIKEGFDIKQPLNYSLQRQYFWNFKMEVENWRNAIGQAKNPIAPRREVLQRLYAQAEFDEELLHEKRLATIEVQAAPFRIVTQNGQEKEKITKLFETQWFQKFLKYSLESEFYGSSLLYFQNTTDLGMVKDLTIVPREHYRPETQEILVRPSDQEGLKVADAIKAGFRLMELGNREDLGLMHVAALLVIRKGYNITDWAIRNEKFGMPFIALNTQVVDKLGLKNRENMLANMGANSFGIFGDKETDVISFHESHSPSNAHMTYLDAIKYYNDGLAKLFNGQTGVSNEKAFVGAANVHERTMGKYTLSRLRERQSDINDILFPFLIEYYNYPLKGCKLEFTELYPSPVTNQPSPTNNEPPQPMQPTEPTKVAKPVAEKKKLSSQLNELYNTEGCCSKTETPPQLTKLSTSLADIFDQAAQNVFNGKLKKGQIDKKLWKANFDEIKKGLDVGLGTEYKTKTDPRIVDKLRNNAGVAMAFKNWHNVSDLVDALVDESGTPRTFEDFKKNTKTINAQYNENWLKSEYQLAQRSATMAADWERIQADADILPNLKYVTVGDDRVREAHAKLDGLILPIDDAFWDSFYPPNGYGCRCTVEPTDAGTKEPRYIPTEKEVPPSFRQNVGKTGETFGSEHPYFDLKPADKKTIEKQIKKLDFGE